MVKNMDKKLLIYLGIGVGCVFLLIILLLIFKLVTGGTKYNSKQFEAKIKEAATSYYKKEKKKLPKNDGDKVTVTIDELVKEGYLKEPEKILKKNLTCKGGVNVSNNNGFYLYQPVIECSDGYNTDLLYKRILKDNPTKVSGDGLYKIGNYYLFRGEKLKNYVKFANKNWQILRITEDNNIRLILIDNLDSVPWDDRYNVEKQDSVGKNIYDISRVKQTLEDYFSGEKSKIFSKEDKALIVPTELCIGARSEDATAMDGSIECSKKTTRLPLGLLQANEYPIISLDSECKKLTDASCTNYNFLRNLSVFWTLTADTKSSYHVYRIGGNADSTFTYSYSQPRIVLNISSDALYSSGTGDINDPYIIK